MAIINIPSQSVVMILGGKRDPLAELADLVPFQSSPWDVEKPKPSLERLHAALTENNSARVVIKRAHAKARHTVASTAHKHGAIAIALLLPGAEEPDTIAEKIDQVHRINSLDGLSFELTQMPWDQRDIRTPLDFIGDVHGCAEELLDLLVDLGHADPQTRAIRHHPEGRRVVLLGDLTDRGPYNLRTLWLAQELERHGGFRVLGNHDDKLARALSGRKVRVAAGLAITMAEMDHLTEEERQDLSDFVFAAQPHLIFDQGRVVAAHAGLAAKHHGRLTGGARSFALYGDVTGGLDEFGHPEANDWALEYDGDAVVVHGHVVYPKPRVHGNVVAVDTGCVFGGDLTAYRWPERTFVSVPAREVYFNPEKCSPSEDEQ